MPRRKDYCHVLLGLCTLWQRQWVSCTHTTLVLTRWKAWDQRDQKGCPEWHPIQTLHLHCRARVVLFLYCEVGIQRFSRFASFSVGSTSHKEVLDMEIQFLQDRVTGKKPKLLIDGIQRMASGEAPFFPTTLSLVFDKLVEKACTKRTSFGFGSGPGGCTEGESSIHPTTPKMSTQTSNIPPPPIVGAIASSSNLQAPASTCGLVPPVTTPDLAWLKCQQCGEVARFRDLHETLRCPQCPPRSVKKGRPFMKCASCDTPQTAPREDCVGKKCRRRFR